MNVEIWSDIVCPWCYIGARRLKNAIEQFEAREELTLRFRSFELNPDAPASSPGDPRQQLAVKLGRSLEQIDELHRRVTEIAAVEGLEYHMDRTQSANSFDAHRVAQFARERNLQEPFLEAVYRSHFTDGALISDHEVLLDAAETAGLDRVEIAKVLADSTRYAADVREDEAEAARLGITGVPFVVVDRRFGISGAQSTELFLQALRQAWDERDAFAQHRATAGALRPD